MDEGIVQWNLTFSAEEDRELIEFLKENEYLLSKQGLKEFILDIVRGSPEEEDKSNPILEAIRDNPQAIHGLGNMAVKSLHYFMNRKKS